MVIYKTVILASGRGWRCRPLTDKTSKCLLEIGGKELLKWTCDNIVKLKEVNEILISVDWCESKFVECFGREYKDKKISYVESPRISKSKIKSRDDYILQYIEPELFVARKGFKFDKVDYFLRFNGDILFDEVSFKKLMKVVRKGYCGFWAMGFACFNRILLEIFCELFKQDRYLLLKVYKKYLSIPFFEDGYEKRMNQYEFYLEILKLVKGRKFVDRINKEIELDKKNLVLRDAFVSDSDLRLIRKIGLNLHENQHVDTKENLEKLRLLKKT